MTELYLTGQPPASIRLEERILHRRGVFPASLFPSRILEMAETIRANHPDALIFGVHMSGICEDDARRIIEVSDLVTGCASTTVRTLAGKKALLQAGDVIPIFALTSQGKEAYDETDPRNQRKIFPQTDPVFR